MNIVHLTGNYFNLNINIKVTIMKEKFTMHIYARRNAPSANGMFPIYIRITIESKRYEFSTKKFVDPKLWSSTLAEMKGKSDEACSINNYLKVLKNRIFDIQIHSPYYITVGGQGFIFC